MIYAHIYGLIIAHLSYPRTELNVHENIEMYMCVHMNISQYNDLVPIYVTDSAKVNALTLHKTDCWPPSSE